MAAAVSHARVVLLARLATVQADERSFSEHIGAGDACAKSDGVVSFPNLSGDARLVVPCKAVGSFIAALLQQIFSDAFYAVNIA